MVAEPRTWIDVEGAVRTWARATLTPLANRIFFGYSEASAQPQIVLQRIGGPDDACLIQFDVWAASKAAAAVEAAKLATALDALSRYTAFATVLLLGARVDSIRWLPDAETDSPRYIVEATIMAVSST